MTFTRDLGTFDSLQAVWTAYPSGGQTGDYLNVGGVIYWWDDSVLPSGNWVMWVPQQNRSTRNANAFDGDVLVGHNLHVGGILDARVVRGRDAFCGLYETAEALATFCPNPLVGQWALVFIQNQEEEVEVETQGEGEPETETVSLALGNVYYCDEDGHWEDAHCKSDVAGLVGMLMGEASARETADDLEAQTREQADNTLQGHIDDEELARRNADTTLQGHIDDEELARRNADTTLQGHIDDNDYAVITNTEMDEVLS